jgi:signal transduction histidine kinase/CHASE3 domain sensor protein
MKFIYRQKFLTVSVIFLVGNCLLGYALFNSSRKLLESENWIEHTKQVITQSTIIFSDSKDLKTDSRDYILTSDDRFVASMKVTAAKLFTDINNLKNLTRDNALQRQRVDSLHYHIQRSFAFALKTVEVRREGGLSAAIKLLSGKNDNYGSVAVRKTINTIRQQEEILLKKRKELNLHTLYMFNQYYTLVFILMVGFTLILLSMLGYHLFQTKERDRQAAELDAANAELTYENGEKVKRADELVIANKELRYQNDQKEQRAAELVVANNELVFQNDEKEIRAVELAFVNKELIFQNDVRKIAENSLLQSESRLKEAQAMARIGNFEVDMVTKTEVWSDEMYHIYGIQKTHATPSKELLFSFIHPDDADEVISAMKRSSKSFNAFAAEFRFIRHDGALRYGYSEARFDWNGNKELIRIYGIIQDVTERKLADIERKKMVNDLMIRNNDLEQFAYIISHNLRAPVANIIGASAALNDVEVTEEDKEILNRGIKTSIMKLDDVVQDLNQILQVKSSVNQTREIVLFSDLVQDIKSSIKNLLKQDIDINCDFEHKAELLTIKPYLYSIFYNLISNSIKYSQPNIPCSVAIKSRVTKNKLLLVFKDNGLGINMEKKGDQVFGLYKRFHENTEGKGMGLYMVKTQVEILGGKISLKSEENVGSEFTIEFALNDVA